MKLTKIPQHIAIIMDGNGRWARKRHLPRVMGHQKGAETVRMVIETCVDLGIPYVTLYAFSQENWKRPKAEINFLMKLLDRYLDSELEAFKKEGIRFSTIGHVGVLPERTQLRLERMKQETKANRKLTVVLALNYGARQEILDAVQRFVSDLSRSNGAYSRRLKALNEKVFSQYLDTAAMPDPDLVIRTSGEMRLSNFLLWQSSYSEFHASKKLWPDFKKEDLLEAIREYGDRQRRFGALA